MELTALFAALPTTGGFGLLVTVIALLLRQNHVDRVQYRADVARIEAARAADAVAATTALKEQAASHAKQMEEVDKKITALAAAVGAALAETEVERRKRWAAEEEAARLRTELGSIRHLGNP